MTNILAKIRYKVQYPYRFWARYRPPRARRFIRFKRTPTVRGVTEKKCEPVKMNPAMISYHTEVVSRVRVMNK